MPQPLPLRDIHLPDAVLWWPPAIGWWFTLIITVMTIAGLWFYLRPTKYKRARKIAATELSTIKSNHSQHQNDQLLCQELSSLIRRVCLSFYSRREIASLTGEDWLVFLDNSANLTEFSQGVGRDLVTAPYGPHTSIDTDQLIVLCHKWLRSITPNKVNKDD